jgi:hypothetical protein
MIDSSALRNAQRALADPTLSPDERNQRISLLAICVCLGFLPERELGAAVAVVREWYRRIHERAVS